MRKLISALIVACGVMFCVQAWAGDEHEAKGVIKDIKSSERKLTISHGPIKTLGMDGMTMDFAVADPGMLQVVQKGHAVSFVMEVDKDGNFTIVDIQDEGMAKGEMSHSDSHHNH
ncbi:MAG: copper-binding protein [Gammaproteobacteria bacterium]|jgi:Cu/Ag efflux protein CusF